MLTTLKITMKNVILLIAVCLSCCLSSKAQTRKLRADEIAYYNKMRAALYDALPHTYKDWVFNGDKKEFDVIRFFCPSPEDHCDGMISVSMGKGDPYSLSIYSDFAMPGDQSAGLATAAYRQIKDFNNGGQLAAALKSTARSKLSIHVFNNISGGAAAAFTLGYCGKNPPQKINLPVPATLAVMGIHSDSCPIMDSGRPSMSPGDGYYDRAVIFLGKPVISSVSNVRSDGLSETKYAIGFDKAKIGIPVTQNIVVTIMGDAEDIKAAIQAINWAKLSAQLGK